MTDSYLSVSIPAELEQFKKIINTLSEVPDECYPSMDFGVKLLKNQAGSVIEAEYYNDNGELTKKVYYDGAAVSSIVHYRNGTVFSEEFYTNSKLTRKCRYKGDGELYGSINYEYDKNDFVTKIKKLVQKNKFEVRYEYDDFKRVHLRHLEYNSKVLNEQKFRYDILDRVVEYQDNVQTIRVDKININNKLIDYTIIDKVGNNIKITNKFLGNEYLSTDIDLNGHKTTVKNSYYLDNLILKKPCATEDDLDYAISSEISKVKQKSEFRCETKRTLSNDITNTIIDSRIKNDTRPLPISVRKMQLLKS